MRIRLLRKLAQLMNGVDVSANRVGDVIELPADRAQMMIALDWAEAVRDNQHECQLSSDASDERH